MSFKTRTRAACIKSAVAEAARPFSCGNCGSLSPLGMEAWHRKWEQQAPRHMQRAWAAYERATREQSA